MSPIVIVYVAFLLLAAVALWGAYRILGTPSRLAPLDYAVVLDDVNKSVARSAAQLRAALEAGTDPQKLEEVAAESRKIFQTGYYQALRLRPSSGADPAAVVRSILGEACEAYEWASRMIGSSQGLRNPVILRAAKDLLNAGDERISEAARELELVRSPALGKSSP